MRFNLLSDAHWESRVDKVLNELSATGYRQFFEARDYGSGLCGITVVFMCREPSLNFKRRIRFSANEKKFYIDIMLDLNQMRGANNEERKRIVADRLIDELPLALQEKRISDFDQRRFVDDLNTWLKESI
jgi:hypothetical protein